MKLSLQITPPWSLFDNIDNYNIAEQEIREKKLPFIIKRPMPNGGCEYWKLEDLQIIN